MSTLSESYQQLISPPINTGATSSRPGGDVINISYTKGKKSLDDQLKELALEQAQRDLEEQSLVPVDTEAKKALWAEEDRALNLALLASEEERAASAEGRAASGEVRAESAEGRAAAGEERSVAQESRAAAADSLSLKQALDAITEQNRQKADAAYAENTYNFAAKKAEDYAASHGPALTPLQQSFNKSNKIVATTPMPAAPAAAASKSMYSGAMSPASAYSASLGAGPTNTYFGLPTDKYSQSANDNLAYKNTLSMSAAGLDYNALNSAYAAAIYNSANPTSNPNLAVNSNYKWVGGKFVYSPLPGQAYR